MLTNEEIIQELENITPERLLELLGNQLISPNMMVNCYLFDVSGNSSLNFPLLHMIAGKKDSVALAQILIAAGADIGAKDSSLKKYDVIGNTPLHAAIAKGDQALALFIIDTIVKQDKLHLLNEVDINPYAGNTPLTLAIKKCMFPVVYRLIDKGADIDKPDRNKNTALHYAAFWQYPELIAFILHKKAIISLDNIEGTLPSQVFQKKKVFIFKEDIRCHEVDFFELYYHHSESKLKKNPACSHQQLKTIVTEMLEGTRNIQNCPAEFLALVDKETKKQLSATWPTIKFEAAARLEDQVTKNWLKYQQYFPDDFLCIPDNLIASQNWVKLFESTYQREYKFLSPEAKSRFSLMHTIDIEGMKKIGLTFNDLNRKNEATTSGKTLLDIATASGNQKLLDYLFDLYAGQNNINLNDLNKALGRSDFNEILNYAELFKQKRLIENIIDLASGAKKDDAYLSLARLAISSSDAELLDNILRKISPTDRFINENNLLLLGIESGSPEIVSLLLKNGADVFFRDTLIRRLEIKRQTQAGSASGLSSLETNDLHIMILAQVRKKDPDLARKFLPLEDGLEGGTLLHAAAYAGSFNVVEHLLATPSIDLNTLDNTGSRITRIVRYNPRLAKLESHYSMVTPLLCAVHRGHHQIVNHLLKLNLDSQGRNQKKLNLSDIKDCLKAAIAQNNPYIFELIIDFVDKYKEFKDFSSVQLQEKLYNDLLLPASSNVEIFNIISNKVSDNMFSKLELTSILRVSHPAALDYILFKKIYGKDSLYKKLILNELFEKMIPIHGRSMEEANKNLNLIAPIFLDLCHVAKIDLNDLTRPITIQGKKVELSILSISLIHGNWPLADSMLKHGALLKIDEIEMVRKSIPETLLPKFLELVRNAFEKNLIVNSELHSNDLRLCETILSDSIGEISELQTVSIFDYIHKSNSQDNFYIDLVMNHIESAILKGQDKTAEAILKNVTSFNLTQLLNITDGTESISMPESKLKMAILFYKRALLEFRKRYEIRESGSYKSVSGKIGGLFGLAFTSEEKMQAIDQVIDFLDGKCSTKDLQKSSKVLSNGELNRFYERMSWLIGKITQQRSMIASPSNSFAGKH